MNLAERIALMVKLGAYLQEESAELQQATAKAYEKNKWFIPEFIHESFQNISRNYLDPKKLEDWVHYYHIDDNIRPYKIGIVMAGNIPLVGFHDFLCAFIMGQQQFIKLSEKDEVLLKHLVDKLTEWNAEVAEAVHIEAMLKDCDAYIATGSNNSARYFHHYFGKYPSIIRNNKTSVAVLNGAETDDELKAFADDVQLYFGLGCRNVSKIFVPEDYNFERLLDAFKKYQYFADITKYRNNYDYNLALMIMNNQYYMQNGNIILSENENLFSPVSVLYYSFYKDETNVFDSLDKDKNVQCIVGKNHVPFGKSQEPGLFDYADGIDTMQFLLSL